MFEKNTGQTVKITTIFNLSACIDWLTLISVSSANHLYYRIRDLYIVNVCAVRQALQAAPIDLCILFFSLYQKRF